jgi:GT2 family glycosyltransferase
LQRNIAAQQAHGTYLVFCDADIILPPNYLFAMHKILIQQHVDFVGTRATSDTKFMVDKFLCLLVFALQRIFIFFNTPFFSGQNLLMRKKVFESLKGFDSTVVNAEDHELVRRAVKKGYTGKIVYNPFHHMSFRRIQREGRLTVTWKYLVSGLHILFKGPIRKPLFEYKMGGKVE